MTKGTWTRRSVLKGMAAASFPLIVPRHVLGNGVIAPSDRLVIASVGIGGKGESDIAAFSASGKADIGFLCDVDTRQTAKTVGNFPKAQFFSDWRRLFEKHANSFDAVSVSTPDHTHAPIALAAMQLGKHVYVQKPLAHNLHENRLLGAAASRYKVVAQMGNQGASEDGVRLLREWYDAGLIGDVSAVYSWTNKPVWPQGLGWPKASSLSLIHI